MDVRQRLGDRPQAEVDAFSARPSSYLAATPGSWLYGGARAARAGPERRLFPGAVAVLLAAIGLLLVVPAPRAIVYLLLLVAAFEMSLGMRGYSYAFLQDHVGIYRGLRALARLGIFVSMFVGVLAGYGYAALAAGRAPAVRVVTAAALALAMLAEYRVAVALTNYPAAPPPVYRLLASQPPGPVAEFPVPNADALPGPDPEYAYMSTFHWFPLVNGYSGVYPPSYIVRIRSLRRFPDDASIARLRLDGVAYVIVHETLYPPAALAPLLDRLSRDSGFSQLGRFDDGRGPAVLYRLR
jgi:hypothetical protein